MKFLDVLLDVEDSFDVLNWSYRAALAFQEMMSLTSRNLMMQGAPRAVSSLSQRFSTYFLLPNLQQMQNDAESIEQSVLVRFGHLKRIYKNHQVKIEARDAAHATVPRRHRSDGEISYSRSLEP